MSSKYQLFAWSPIPAIQLIALGHSHAGQGRRRLDRQAAYLQGRAASTGFPPMAQHSFNAMPESSEAAQHRCAARAVGRRGVG
ncbi:MULTISPECIES: hypothetical protein, partial [unclassified Sphingomonas]|uniref:hypothetical protein n=1 Tax=unclassified Sphingomonas TaxID=196159 RepID=UPI0019D268CF